MVKMATGQYSVDSLSGAERSYCVDAAAGTCSCPHYQVRLAGTDKVCKHITLVRAELAAQPTELERAARVAKTLPDAALTRSLEQYQSGPVACAIRLERAKRLLAEQQNAELLRIFS